MTRKSFSDRCAAEATRDAIFLLQVRRVITTGFPASDDGEYGHDGEGVRLGDTNKDGLWTPREDAPYLTEDELAEMETAEGVPSVIFHWETIGVFLTREEADQYGKATSHRYGKWRVYCVPAEGELAGMIRDQERVIAEIATERRRQVKQEGWTPEHDDTHTEGQLVKAAACYALNGRIPSIHICWPWDMKWWKPTNRPRRDLVKAAALIVAEIERLDRQEAKVIDRWTADLIVTAPVIHVRKRAVNSTMKYIAIRMRANGHGCTNQVQYSWREGDYLVFTKESLQSRLATLPHPSTIAKLSTATVIDNAIAALLPELLLKEFDRAPEEQVPQ